MNAKKENIITKKHVFTIMFVMGIVLNWGWCKVGCGGVGVSTREGSGPVSLVGGVAGLKAPKIFIKPLSNFGEISRTTKTGLIGGRIFNFMIIKALKDIYKYMFI